jgi:hypothetical protein
MRRPSFATYAIIATTLNTPAYAFIAPGCSNQSYSASDIAQAIRNADGASDTLKSNACNFGGAALAESGGNTCESNGNNFGVLQLTRSNLPPGMTAAQYLSLPMPQQVSVWAQQVGDSNTSGAYETLANVSNIGGTQVTAGMLMACFQFGPLICNNDIAYMQTHGGQAPTAASGGVRATASTLSNGTANLDGNNQSIASWGGAIQNRITQAAATCTPTNGGGGSGTNCPTNSTTPGTIISPSPGNAPVSLPPNLA